MYYVLCSVYYALPLGVNIVCYVLCITYYAYYALRTGHIVYYVCVDSTIGHLCQMSSVVAIVTVLG